MTWVKVGARCVLVNKAGALNEGQSSSDLGDVCEIMEVSTIQGFLCVRCKEINGKWSHGFGEWAKASRYRPLLAKTIEDDIAVFKRIADQVPNMEMQDD